MKYHFHIRDFFIGILCLFLFIGIGLNIAIFFRPLYEWDISYLSLEDYSGFSRAKILENYHALIDYCSPFFTGDLIFPSMEISAPALTHFAKVKRLFLIFDFLACASFFILLFFFFRSRAQKKKNASCLLTAGITASAIPVFLGICCGIFWDQTFVLFHKIFFPGDYWIFDWNKDPIIRILPDTFFLQCAVLIIGTVLLFSLFLIITGIRQLRRH